MGLGAHYYADTLQPFHADYRALAYQSGSSNLHNLRACGRRLQSLPAHASWVTPRSRHGVSDVRRKTILGSLLLARPFQPAARWAQAFLIGHDRRHEPRDARGHEPHLEENADIVATIPTGKGPTMRRYYPARYSKACAYAKCLDSSGNPMQGVAVRFTWNLSQGPVSAIAYTDARASRITGRTSVGHRSCARLPSSERQLERDHPFRRDVVHGDPRPRRRAR